MVTKSIGLFDAMRLSACRCETGQPPCHAARTSVQPIAFNASILHATAQCSGLDILNRFDTTRREARVSITVRGRQIRASPSGSSSFRPTAALVAGALAAVQVRRHRPHDGLKLGMVLPEVEMLGSGRHAAPPRFDTPHALSTCPEVPAGFRNDVAAFPRVALTDSDFLGKSWQSGDLVHRVLVKPRLRFGQPLRPLADVSGRVSGCTAFAFPPLQAKPQQQQQQAFPLALRPRNTKECCCCCFVLYCYVL